MNSNDFYLSLATDQIKLRTGKLLTKLNLHNFCYPEPVAPRHPIGRLGKALGEVKDELALLLS